ncbi:MAG: DUF4838 domain-containing protein [Clostridia bacterium]|nr:DUF4838 domain-containing protein [Clostridia bacterium]
MKIKNAAICLLLSICTVMCACTPDNQDSTPETLGTLNESNEGHHYVEGTLHNVNVNYNAPVSDFVVNGHTEYKVVIGGTNSGKAAGLMMEHVNKATGGDLQSIEISQLSSDMVSQDTKYIFIGCEDLYREKVGEISSYDTLGPSGYQIATYGKNIFLNGYTIHGYQMGTLAFLRAVVGYDMLAEDCVIYEKDGKKMPSMDIVERPDFDYRHCSGTALSSVEMLGMGYTYEDPIINTGESWVHNWYDFVSVEEAEANPDWASEDPTHWQGCWTAHGNQDSYTRLINHLTEKLKGYLIQYPSKSTILIGQHDVGTYTPSVDRCTCKSCDASYEYYGTMAGAWLSLCNRVSVKVDEWLKTEEAISIFGGERKWNLIALIYHASLNPPIEKENGLYVFDENGQSIPKKEMWFTSDGKKMEWEDAWTDENGESLEEDFIKAWSDTHERIYSAPNVHFMFAASSGDYAHSYYEPENASWKMIADGWSSLGGEFYAWLYSFNSRAILYPYHAWDTTFETTRYFKSKGAKWIYWQTQYQNKNNPGFNKLRNYLNSKVEFDVNSDYNFYLDKFFKYYYGEAGEIMRTYFEQINAQCRWIEEVNGVVAIHRNEKLTDAKNWPEGLIHTWRALLDSAFDVIELEYKASNPKQYEIYHRHILMEQLFPTYVLCTTYANSFNASDLKEMRLQFIDDFYALGNKSYWELGLMTEVTDTWDLD